MDKSQMLTWLEISEQAYAKNLQFFRNRLSANTEFSVVVKANGYGHGIREITALADKYHVDSLCVHSLDEAMLLRNSGEQKDILIMGHIPLEQLPTVIGKNLRIAVFTFETLLRLAELSDEHREKIRIHLKLETGTYRQGIEATDLPKFLEKIRQHPFLFLEAVYTHFANIEDTTNHNYALGQLKLFNELTHRVRQSGYPEIKCHSACSAAVLLFPETHFDMVRLGISQYGLWPSRETFVSYKIKHTRNGLDVLQPVLSWKTRIGQIKTVPKNHCVGYGCSYQTTRESRIAILPIGYSDGYDRGLSNQSYVLICGRRAPVRGRVCMNMTMVDITDIPEARLEEEVVLFGRQDGEFLSVDQLASLTGSINYELVSRINSQIPRIII